MTGQQTQSSKHSASFAGTGSKKDQKDGKRTVGHGDRKDNKTSSQSGSAARRSMSDDVHEDVYMAKTENQRPRKRTLKAASVIEATSN